MKALLTVDQLATYIQKSPASVRCDASRNPKSLPPICRLPGSKRLLWRVEDVESWLAQHVQNTAPPVRSAQQAPDTQATIPPKKRGRPTKAESMARQRQIAGSTAQSARRG